MTLLFARTKIGSLSVFFIKMKGNNIFKRIKYLFLCLSLFICHYSIYYYHQYDIVLLYILEHKNFSLKKEIDVGIV